jgi:hypothetical protein
MTPKRLQHLEQHLKTWRETHPDAASLRAAYRQRVLDFTLNSMALEQEPVDRARLQALLNPQPTQPVR